MLDKAQTKLHCVFVFILCVGCASGPSPTKSSETSVENRDEPRAREQSVSPSSRPLAGLSPSTFEFASLTWESGVSDFDRVFGARTEDNQVNPRLRHTCYVAQLDIDPVWVCAEFSSRRANYIYVVAQADYTGSELEDAFNEWKQMLEERLGEGKPESFHHQGTSLDWHLEDKTKVRLSKEGGDLRIDFWSAD